jgi:hypothetical protein
MTFSKDISSCFSYAQLFILENVFWGGYDEWLCGYIPDEGGVGTDRPGFF